MVSGAGRANEIGRSRGKYAGITEVGLPTSKVIETDFAIEYRIKDEVIVDHWMMVDQMKLMEQLGMKDSV